MMWHKNRKQWSFQKATYRESTEELHNPGCGWYQICSFAAESPPDPEMLGWCLSGDEQLVLVLIDIGTFRDIPLTSQALEHIETVFRFFSGRGTDMILRFVYDREGKGMEREPAFFSLVEKHMKQTGAVIQQYAAHILLVQGVYVGSWGEMHGSKFLSGEMLKQLSDILWESVGGCCYLAVRRPVQWRILFGKEDGSARCKSTGLFNDGMFGSDTDLGTYAQQSEADVLWQEPWCREKELEFTRRLSDRIPYGGEAVGTADQSGLSQAVLEMRRSRVSYLNRIHDTQVLEKWKESIWQGTDGYAGMNGYAYIGRHLGYRFVLRDVLPEKQEKNGLQIRIENVGFANLYEEAKLCLLIRSPEGKQTTKRIAADPRDWTSGQIAVVRLSVEVTSAGCHELYLQLRREKDGEIIRFANEGAQTCVHIGSFCKLQ